MGLQATHGLYFVGLGSTLLGGITRENLAIESEINGEPQSGEVYRRFLALYSQKVAPGFSTTSIAAALAACGGTGASLAGMTGGLALYAQKHADGATRATGAVHKKFTMVKGILAPQRLTVDHRGDASLEYAAVVAWDGTNDPVQITDNASLPDAVADEGRWTLGPTAIGGKTLDGKRQFTIDFGIEVVAESADSEVWDRIVSIRTIQSMLTLRGVDVDWFKSTNIPLTGLACTHANTAIYLRKRASASTFVADGTAAHCKFNVAGMAHVQRIEASGKAPAECAISIPVYWDGTNANIAMDLAAAIS